MNIRNGLKFIGNELLFIFAIAVFIVLVTLLGAVATILLAMLGHLIGIDMDILSISLCSVYFGKYGTL